MSLVGNQTQEERERQADLNRRRNREKRAGEYEDGLFSKGIPLPGGGTAKPGKTYQGTDTLGKYSQLTPTDAPGSTLATGDRSRMDANSKNSKYGFAPPPVRQPTYDPRTGELLPQYQLDVMKERGISPLGQLEIQRQNSLLKSNIGDLYGRSAAGMADARGRLAQTQGLSGGAAERIGRYGNRDRMNALQQMYGGHQRNQLGIRGQDIGRQIQADQNNINTNLSEIEKQYQGNLQGYDIGAKIHSGELMADAIGRGGQGGGGAAEGFMNNMMSPNIYGIAGAAAGGYFGGGPGGAAGGYAAGQQLSNQWSLPGAVGQHENFQDPNAGTSQPQMQQQPQPQPSSGGNYQASMPTAGYQQGMGRPMQNAYGNQQNPYSSGM